MMTRLSGGRVVAEADNSCPLEGAGGESCRALRPPRRFPAPSPHHTQPAFPGSAVRLASFPRGFGGASEKTTAHGRTAGCPGGRKPPGRLIRDNRRKPR